MKKTVSRILIGAIFLAGLSLLLYPFVANEWNTYRQQRLITGYDDTVAQLEEEGSVDYEAEWEKARAYNAELVPSVLPDSFAVAAASEEPDEDEDPEEGGRTTRIDFGKLQFGRDYEIK